MLLKSTYHSKDFANRSRMIIYSIFVVGLLTISFLISCQKDLLLGENDKDLKRAREWYNSQIGKSKNFIQLKDQLPVQLQENALWDKAELTRLDDGTKVIKVPIESNISNILNKKGSLQIVIENKNEKYRSRYVGNTNTSSENKPVKELYNFAFLNNAKVMSTSKLSDVNNADNKETEQTSNRGVDCTDWYWVTKTFVDGELVDTFMEYLGQTCVGDFSGGGTSGTGGTGVGTSDGKFGEDPNCNNCVISPQNFLALKAYARDAGLIVRPGFATTLTLADGSVHTGIITEIRSPDGALAAAFFNPDNSVGDLISGYNYSVGNSGPTGTNSNSNSNIVLSNNAIWGFGTTLPDNGGYGPNTTYTRDADLQSFINTIGATATKAAYLDNHYKVFEILKNYLNANGQTQDNIEFSNWSIDYLMQNASVSLNDFTNQFLFKTAESSDGLNDFDSNYWDNPNLVIAQENLPSYTDFYLAYPKNSSGFEMEAGSVFNLVGGVPKNLRDASLSDNNPNNDNTYGNACALRVSRALNYSGINIPEVAGTYKGGDGKNYFLSAASLNAWMLKAFPPTPFNSITLTSVDAGPHGAGFANAIAGSKGIYILIPNYPGNSYFGATGHAGIHTYPSMTHYYFDAKGGVNKITLWKLF